MNEVEAVVVRVETAVVLSQCGGRVGKCRSGIGALETVRAVIADEVNDVATDGTIADQRGRALARC